MNSNKENIEKLKNIISTQLTPLINNDFILLDIPNHRNIGDSLIWKGELEFFKELEYKCIGQYNRYTFKKNVVKSEKTIILLHGGGNFGDIYESSQSFKRYIIENFPNNRIIVLPQTVHYNNEANLKRDFAIFNRHNDLYVFVRDFVSYDILKVNFNEEKLKLTPDMAFFLNFDSDIKSNPAETKSLYLNRTDAEASKDSFQDSIEGEYHIQDWPTYNSTSSRMNTLTNYVEALDGKLSKVIKHVPVLSLMIDNAYGLKKKNGMDLHINRGKEFINEYNKVYTTRLHGLILSILLDREVVILDNVYGKSKNFYDAWLKDFNNVKLYVKNEY
ncbi:exopolysaccharide biosynthesis protein [Chryseobacterium elymi]|uniref:Exopolysaccharide biosynthesis protein n=1 Tax=Chryseobacterium elymi TaxID=395936 RepID=A0A3D9DPH2_9FLAO|nr:polysaccharide pyruvyl transferase family protein [Chryseobacterium elymi]REC79914.1 exopolysaccharide biosynthesis protein [Chryseobacterium elymi]